MRNSLIVALIVLIVPASVKGHDWYDAACCSDRDCKPVPSDSIRWTTAGWLIVETGEIIPEEQAKMSQDNEFHRCSRHFQFPYLDDDTICLYVPGAGV